jgi:hypothetical protein
MKTRLDLLANLAISPRSWPTRIRQAFLLTLPVSLPLWLAFVVLLGALFPARKLGKVVSHFWSAPPRPPRAGYYGYGRRGKHQSLRHIRLAENDIAA